MSTNIYFIIPVFNEAENIATLFGSLKQLVLELEPEHNLHFILVNDGSSDGTREALTQQAGSLNLTVINHEVNKGPGRAFGTAFHHISTFIQGSDWVVTMEGDNTSRHELLQQMLTRTKEGYDVVLASPYLYGGGITNTSSFRVFLSHMANTFLREFLGIHGIATMSSFFRLYRGSVIQKLQAQYGTQIIERRGFESMIEQLLKMIYLEVKISEVAMLLDTSRRAGKSKMKILRTIRGYFSLWTEKNKWRPTLAESNKLAQSASGQPARQEQL